MRDAESGGTQVVARRLPVGAEIDAGGASFRVWAPKRRRVSVCFESGRSVALQAEADGWFSTRVAGVRAGDLYRFLLDDQPTPRPDPASRFQPAGPDGPSEVVDPDAFDWSDADWPGVTLPGHVIYELHVGTFTPAGTWAAAREKLGLLADTGISVIELMPVAAFPGRFGWGYDGVAPFAPTQLYGSPDDMRRFIDAAHGLGLGVILDLVCNHFGPEGCYLPDFSDAWFSRTHTTDWGDAINFDEDGSAAVRDFFLANVEHWISEYHLDGFRFDATRDIHDGSDEHILLALARKARSAARPRDILLIAENEPQDSRLARPPQSGGFGLDAIWNDDWHHSASVALTGRREAYYGDYFGDARELASAARYGFLFQGQNYGWQNKRRGTPTRGLPRAAMVQYLENHDQVANSERGQRLHQLAAPGPLRALTALLLLAPATPLLFQGQEWAAGAPFLYFADLAPSLADGVRRGRAGFLQQFRNIALPELQSRLSDPLSPDTFRRSKLDWSERERNAAVIALHRDLIRLRREDPVLSRQGADGFDTVALTRDTLLLRWFTPDDDDRLLVVDLGRDTRFSPASEPLLAPPAGRRWRNRWSSEDPRYGGRGTPPLEDDAGAWSIPGATAALLVPTDADPLT